MSTKGTRRRGGWPLRIAAALLLAATAARAGVLTVNANGGGDFTEIQPAVNAAQNGDTILVAGSSGYWPFVIDGKGLQIVVDLGGHADVEFEAGPGITIRNLPPGAPVLLRGLRSAPAAFPLGDPRGEGLLVADCAAEVRVEDGAFDGADGFSGFQPHKAGWAGARVTGCASVAFTRCALEGGAGFSPFAFFSVPESAGAGAPGLDAASSKTWLHDDTLLGGDGGTVGGIIGSTFPGGSAGDGATLAGTIAFASGTSFAGGDGGSGGSAAGGCGAGGSGGHGLHLAAGAPSLVRLDSPAAGGSGGIGGGGQSGPPGCAPDGAPGQAVLADPGAVALVEAGAARHLVLSAVTREQGSVTLTVQGAAGDAAFLLVSFAPGSKWIPNLKGVLLPAATPLLTFGLGPLPAPGVLSLGVAIPELGAGVDAIWIHAQAALHGAVDGWVLSSPSACLLLDASL